MSRKPPYRALYVQILCAILIGALLAVVFPKAAVAMKPLGDGFIRLIRMMIALVIFCTVVAGIAGMRDMQKLGRVGVRSLLYFEVVSSLALVIGLLVGNWIKPGVGFDASSASLDANAVSAYSGQAQNQTVTEFLLGVIPQTVTSAFADGNVLQVLLVSVLFGLAIAALGERAQPLRSLVDALAEISFRVIALVLKLAPIGAFGAMAFTLGKYGIAALGPLVKLIATLYFTCAVFIVVVLGAVARLAGFNILRLLAYLKEEILIVLGTSSSESALPSLMEKLERLGCSRSVVGLVVPTGYTFNTDGTSIYMTMAALFVAQATNTDLTLTQQLTILGVAMVTSKGASGVSGAAFIALVATLHVVPAIPVAGMAIILGVDRFLSEARAVTNMIGNGVAALVMARLEGELDSAQLRRALRGESGPGG